jgi:DNA-binding NarL/FixJ family response regulator
MSAIRVMLVDDHALFRSGVAAVLAASSEFEVVGEAENGLQAVEMARELMPDIILMDISMPGLDGIETTRRVKAEMPYARIVVLTASDGDAHLFDAIKAGAQGFLLKKIDPKTLYSTLRGAMQGEAAVTRIMASRILEEFARQARESRPRGPEPNRVGPAGSLSAREKEVLELVARGKSNKEIASAFGTAENTVKNQLKNILEKLQLQNRVQAAMFALREGLVDGPSDPGGPPRRP